MCRDCPLQLGGVLGFSGAFSATILMVGNATRAACEKHPWRFLLCESTSAFGASHSPVQT